MRSVRFVHPALCPELTCACMQTLPVKIGLCLILAAEHSAEPSPKRVRQRKRRSGPLELWNWVDEEQCQMQSGNFSFDGSLHEMVSTRIPRPSLLESLRAGCKVIQKQHSQGRWDTYRNQDTCFECLRQTKIRRNFALSGKSSSVKLSQHKQC